MRGQGFTAGEEDRRRREKAINSLASQLMMGMTNRQAVDFFDAIIENAEAMRVSIQEDIELGSGPHAVVTWRER